MGCRLCGRDVQLLESHIIPAFAIRWIKESSATGYMRSVITPEKRLQDGVKVRLLCADCELRLSPSEKSFAESIFTPYVHDDLNEMAVARGNITMDYSEWLLRFIVSVQWRLVETSRDDESAWESLTEKQKTAFKTAAEFWKKYLLGFRRDTGSGDHHVIFLQSMSGVKGGLPNYISDHIDAYLLRATDGTIVTGRSIVAVYAKLGPIVLYTSILPPRITGLQNTRIHRKGTLTSVQSLMNSRLSRFIFVDRPKETIIDAMPSQKSEQQIIKSISRDPKRAINSMSRVVSRTTEIIKEKKSIESK